MRGLVLIAGSEGWGGNWEHDFSIILPTPSGACWHGAGGRIDAINANYWWPAVAGGGRSSNMLEEAGGWEDFQLTTARTGRMQ